MPVRPFRRATLLAMGVFVAGVSACGVPRPGPTMNEIFAGSVLREGDAFIVAVGDRVSRAANVPEALGFSDALVSARVLSSDTIRAGDTVALTVFENVPEGLLSGSDTRGARLVELQVDEQGFIYVPFAGRVRAAGQSPEGLRSAIAQQLDEQTPDPQVYVSRTSRQRGDRGRSGLWSRAPVSCRSTSLTRQARIGDARRCWRGQHSAPDRRRARRAGPDF
ncbi:MAG: polysaccharide biosynthesis/export family protein [Paracoccaceae bacterium]